MSVKRRRQGILLVCPAVGGNAEWEHPDTIANHSCLVHPDTTGHGSPLLSLPLRLLHTMGSALQVLPACCDAAQTRPGTAADTRGVET